MAAVVAKEKLGGLSEGCFNLSRESANAAA
jgi:hypothetical protein